MSRRSLVACITLMAAASILAAASSTALASHRDDGLIVCTDIDTCFTQDDSDDPGGNDASSIVTIGGDTSDLPPVPLPPIDSGTSFPPSSPATTPPDSPAATAAPAPAGSQSASSSATTSEQTTTPTVTTDEPAAAQPQPTTTDQKKVSSATTTTVVTEPEPAPQPPPPPPPKCLNHPDWADVQPGYRRDSDGECYEIPKLDLQISGPTSLGAATSSPLALKVTNNGSTLASAVLFHVHVDGSLVIGPIATSQGDPCGQEDATTYYCSLGTIVPGQSATVTVNLKVAGAGTATSRVEPGGEADTDTDNNQVVTAVSLLSVRQLVALHGLPWGGHYYGSVPDFTRILRKQGATWRGWKRNHPALAAGLLTHDKLSRRLKRH